MACRLRPWLSMAVAAWAFTTSSLVLPGHAIAQQDTTQAPPASDTQLDELLASHQWNALGAALRVDPNSISRMMDWLHQRIDTGGGLLLPLIFARDLWMVGDHLKVADPEQDVRVTSGMMTLYAYSLIVVDGKTCEDQTAPAHRLDQLFQARAATLAFVRALPTDLKMKVVDLAIRLERKTAPLRGDDDLVCRDGLAQMKAGLSQGKQSEAPSVPGTFGRNVLVEPPADWKPGRVPASVYLPQQGEARKGMRANMIKLVTAEPTAL